MFMASDDENGFNKVKIEKILTISSMLAEVSNVATVVVTQDISKLDIGGLISMVHQIVISKRTQLEIEMKYVKKEFRTIVMEEI